MYFFRREIQVPTRYQSIVLNVSMNVDLLVCIMIFHDQRVPSIRISNVVPSVRHVVVSVFFAAGCCLHITAICVKFRWIIFYLYLRFEGDLGLDRGVIGLSRLF